MLSLLYDSAIRVQEFIDLSKNDINLQISASLTVTGKGRKIRQVPLMENTAKLMNRYISMNPRLNTNKADEPLFISHTGTRFTRPGVTHILKKYCSCAFGTDGLSFPVTPHTLRHSKGMHMLHAEINVYYIKEFLGHSDICTTERFYVRADTEMKRKALQKMQNNMVPEQVTDIPVWQKDSDLLSWLKSFG